MTRPWNLRAASDVMQRSFRSSGSLLFPIFLPQRSLHPYPIEPCSSSPVVWQVHRRPMLRPGPRANDDGAAGVD